MNHDLNAGRAITNARAIRARRTVRWTLALALVVIGPGVYLTSETSRSAYAAGLQATAARAPMDARDSSHT